MSEESRALLIREALPKLSASEIPTYHNRTGLSNLRSLAARNLLPFLQLTVPRKWQLSCPQLYRLTI
jgi:hypothetical protein